ncbi:hypothetical protein ACFFRR_008060 [Megaselia abdita]
MFSRLQNQKILVVEDNYCGFKEAFESCNFYRLQEILRTKPVLSEMKNTCEMNWAEEKAKNEPLTKSDEKSNLILNELNKLSCGATPSNHSLYLSMIKRYEKALCFAESDECKFKAYDNISKMYKNLDFFDHCLAACDSAMKHSASADEESKQKIKARIAECEAETGDPTVKVSSKTFVSSFIKMCVNNSVVATKSLSPGDIVAATKPFVLISDEEFRRQTCNHCGNRLSAVKIPCDNCVHATFCSENCKKAESHTMECFLFCDNYLLEDPNIHIALKFTIKALEITKGKYFVDDDEFSCFDWEKTASSHSYSSYGIPKDRKNNDGNILKSILNMKKANVDFEEMIGCTLKFNQILEKLKSLQIFNDFIATLKNGEKSFSEMFFRSYRLIRYNGFDADSKYNIDGFYGTLTHSCKPNLMVFQDSSGINSYVVLEEIQRGDQLTIAFRNVVYHSLPRQERRFLLEDYLGIKCFCVACVQSLPTDANAEKGKKIWSEFTRNIADIEDTSNFKDLIKDFIKPSYDGFARRALFKVLFYLHLNHMDVFANSTSAFETK